MKVSIDSGRCQGHGRCYDLAPELFGEDAEGYGTVLADGTVPPEQEHDARKAVVARHFARTRLAPPPVRGILEDDRTVVDLFDPLVRYGTIERAAAAAA